MLGISIYPEKSSFEENKRYIDTSVSLGFGRVFTSLLELTGDQEQVLANFKAIVEYASSKGMQVIVDINPMIFNQLGISHDDLSFFHDLGAYGLRLDMGFTGREEAIMTRNPYGLKIELNMSMGISNVDVIMQFNPKKENLIACHNFYPMRYSGLDEAFFKKTTESFTKHNLRTAAFVTTQTGQLGPWPMQDRLCTLEMHRDLSIEAQTSYFVMEGSMDDIIIGDAFASDEELEKMSKAYFAQYPEIECVLEDNISAIEKTIVNEMVHSYRGDYNGYMIRSSMPRITYKEIPIQPVNTHDVLKRGDIIIGNNAFGQYKGELQIVLKEMKNKGQVNVVGHLTDNGYALLDCIKPWSNFRLVTK